MVTITGCDSKKEKKNNNETITIEDKNNGFKTTFTYLKDKKFEVEDAKEEGKYKEVIIKNADKNIKSDIQDLLNTIKFEKIDQSIFFIEKK